jgi:DNA modification methylase
LFAGYIREGWCLICEDAGVEYTIIEGDSRTAMPEAEFDLILTSPPYNVRMPYAGHDDDLPLAGWRALIKTVLMEAWDRLVDGGRLVVNVQHGVGRTPMIPLGFHVEGIGHELADAFYRGCIIWDKGPVNTTAWGSWMSPSNPVLRGTYEQVHVWSKGSPSRKGGPGDLTQSEFTEATLDTWHIAAEQSRKDHPAPFPVALAERLIKLYTWPGDRVLDPFMGIGSSGVAAKRVGREWVGIDTSPDYCRIAAERLAATHEGDGTTAEVALSDELRAVAAEFAKVLAQGAHAAGKLEVRRVQLTPSAGSWERYRRTLSNHVQLGAYGVIQRQNASRVFWVAGDEQSSTFRSWTKKPQRTIRADSIEELEAKLIIDVSQVLVEVSGDRRTRAVTPRGFALN